MRSPARPADSMISSASASRSFAFSATQRAQWLLRSTAPSTAGSPRRRATSTASRQSACRRSYGSENVISSARRPSTRARSPGLWSPSRSSASSRNPTSASSRRTAAKATSRPPKPSAARASSIGLPTFRAIPAARSEASLARSYSPARQSVSLSLSRRAHTPSALCSRSSRAWSPTS